MNRHLFSLSATCAVALLLAACSKESPAPSTVVTETGAIPSMETIMRGAQLYQEHCAQCHGPEAQGHPDWQIPEAMAAPPLNGTGNEWKRTRAEMIALIENGLKRNNEAVHPAYKGRIGTADVETIITWYQALWPAEVYERWQKANAAVPGAKPRG